MITRYKSQVKKMFAPNTRRYTLMLLSTTFIIFLVSSQFAFAADEFKNPLKYDTLQKLLMAIIKTVIYIMTPIIVLMVVYTGFLFVMAQGNPAKLTTARTSLMWTLIGAVIVLGAFGISAAIKSTVDSVIS